MTTSVSHLLEREPSFGHRLKLGIWIYRSNLRTILPVVLLVSVPGNLLITYLLQNVLGNPGTLGDVIVDSIVEGLFGPIEMAAVLLLLECWRAGSHLTVGGALRQGVKRWPQVFLGEQFAGLFFLVGLLLLVIPGILVAVRFSLVGAVAALEGRWPLPAMGRSGELTRGRRLQIFGTFALFYAVQMAASALVGLPFTAAGWDRSFWGSAAQGCIDSIVESIGYAYVYVFYVECVMRAAESDPGDPIPESVLP